MHHVFEQRWTAIVENCLATFLNSSEVERGLQLMDVAPVGHTTKLLTSFRQRVYNCFRPHATGKESVVNQGGGVSPQLVYTDDMNTITNAESRRIFREWFAVSLIQASYVYRNFNAALQREAEELVEKALQLDQIVNAL